MTSSLYADWRPIIERAYGTLDSRYRSFLQKDNSYFPTQHHIFNAFRTLPRADVKYILLGQDPYPRKESASGYAFIDNKVSKIFSGSGLSKEVNRATSLRNFIKMALVARGDLAAEDTSQSAIAAIDKNGLIDSMDALRQNFEREGVLLLNTALIFTSKQETRLHIKAWRPFMQSLLDQLEPQAPKLILFGTYAKSLKKEFALDGFESIELEHPYNHTFIKNPAALSLFGDMRLLET